MENGSSFAPGNKYEPSNRSTNLNNASDSALPAHRRPPVVSRYFDNHEDLEDPFVDPGSTFATVPAPSRGVPPILNRPPARYETLSPPNWSRLQGRGEQVGMFGSSHYYPSAIPNTNATSTDPSGLLSQGRREGSGNPSRLSASHRKDSKLRNTKISFDHPLHQERDRIRESRRHQEANWEDLSTRFPQKSRDINWPPAQYHEMAMKEICVEEFELLESISRIQKGESCVDVGLHPTLVDKCLRHEIRMRNTGSVDPDNVRRPMAYRYGASFPAQPSNPHHSVFPHLPPHMVIPSIEKRSNDSNDKLKNKGQPDSTQPTHASSSMRFSNLPTRNVHGGMTHRFPAGQNLSTMQTVPILDPTRDARHLDMERSRQIPVVDLSGESNKVRVADRAYHACFPAGHNPLSTPRSRLNNTGFEVKRQHEADTPSGNDNNWKRRRLTTEFQQFGGSQEHFSKKVEQWRRDSSVIATATSVRRVSNEEENDDNAD